MSSANRIARRYAKGLYQLDRGDLAKAKSHMEMLSTLRELYHDKEANKILRSPVMPTALKKELLEYGLQQGKADQPVRSLVGAVLAGGRVDVLPELAEAFQGFIDESEGVAKGEVTSAVPLGDAELRSIGESIGRILKKRVEVSASVDPALLGGFVASVGNYRIDMSLKTKLDRLSQAAAQDSLR